MTDPILNSEITVMTKHIPIIGVQQPEKLAEGLCPHCRSMIDLWMTVQGLVLSPNGKGYPEEQPLAMSIEGCAARQSIPIIVDTPKSFSSCEPKNKPALSKRVMSLLLKPLPCPFYFTRTVFLVLLTIASTALLIQIWLAIGEPRLIDLHAGWSVWANLLLLLCALAALNFLAYKCRLSNSSANQLDRWMLASSIVVLTYTLLSSVVLPLLLATT